MAVSVIQVYKNEDVNNPEYSTTEEVRRAFFGRGVFIKNPDSVYEKVVTFDPKNSIVGTTKRSYKFAKPE